MCFKMKYMGSKNRHSKDLLSIILKDRKDNQYYIEPFMGGCNLIDKVDGNRIGNDIHYYLVELFKAISLSWIPPDFVSNEEYNEIRLNKDKFAPELVGFVGFGCSYSGKWFGGYARGNDNKGNPRNYTLESKKNILGQAESLKNVQFYNKNYWELEIPANSIIYCDPPYQGTTKYKDKFDHVKFWDWCRLMSISGHNVYISEYNAPDDFECLWSKEVFNSLTKETGSKVGIEKLFKYKG